jgi:hypothetical protein
MRVSTRRGALALNRLEPCSVLQKLRMHANEPTDRRSGHAFALIASRFVLKTRDPATGCPTHVAIGAGVGMVRYFFVLTAAITMASAGYAQEGRHKGTAEQQRACRPDAVRLCRGLHEDEAIYTCLKTNIAKLRSVCREVIEGSR